MRRSRLPFGVLVTLAEEDELEPEEPLGVAIGVVGLYVTPLASAATWKTDPFPYS